MSHPAPIIDTHCHLDVDEFDADRGAVIDRARAAGVSDIVVPAIRSATWTALLDLCDTERFLHPALGLHPVYVADHRDGDLDVLDQLLSDRRPVAVGEIGLDFYLKDLDRDRQLAFAASQLDLAARHRLPVVLHVRKAHDQMLKLLADHPVPGGTAHAFNGSIQQGEKYIAMGFKLGFGGMLTFERSRKLRNLAATLPLDGIVLETDAPDMPPASRQHQRNSPEYLPEILAALAAIRGLPVEEVAAATSANAGKVFDLAPASHRVSG